MESSISKQNTKIIIYKGKEKEIPISNPDSKLCEFYIIARMRYCKFEKTSDSEYCIYHIPNNEDNTTFVDCPIDPSHRVYSSKLKKHIKVCNKLGERKKLVENVWYKEKINKVVENDEKILLKLSESGVSSLKELYELKWEELNVEEYSDMLDKIIKCYEILKVDYKAYIEKENLDNILNKQSLAKLKLINIENNNFILKVSGIEVDDKDLHFTKGLPKSEKNGKQNEAISNVLNLFDFIDYSNIFIEFGAGKGGLSHHINKITNDNSLHILLEREGVRYKKDKYSDNLVRFRTDILDFKLNYLDDYLKENENNIHLKNSSGEIFKISESKFNLVGIAKHICGCALDLSLSCLLNYSDNSKVKAICMATCCHHLCNVEFLNNLSFYCEYLKLNLKEVILIFKATSWIFGPIDIKHEEHTKNMKSNQIFLQKGLKKNYIGLISKYIVDFARVFFLISQNFKVFYLKYCDNEITTENNLILAINNKI